jgi:hypothetical protein
MPFAGVYGEVLNTDADLYGGSGVGNYGSVTADSTPWHGMPASVEVSLPPLGALWFAPRDGVPAELGEDAAEIGGALELDANAGVPE